MVEQAVKMVLVYNPYFVHPSTSISFSFQHFIIPLWLNTTMKMLFMSVDYCLWKL